MSTVYAVIANAHDYDVMNEWFVGVFSSEELANDAIAKDKKKYNGRMKGGPNYEIYPAVIDEACDD